jgi:hypothetical protein
MMTEQTLNPLTRIRELVREGDALARSENEKVGAEAFLQFAKDAEAFATAFEDKLPAAAQEMRLLRWNVGLIGDNEYAKLSANAYREDESDVLIDFRYQDFARAAQILRAVEARFIADLELPSTAIRETPATGEDPTPSLGNLATWSHALNETKVSRLLGVEPSTLQKWRVTSKGPPFFKVGRLVRYNPQAVLEYTKGNESRG